MEAAHQLQVATSSKKDKALFLLIGQAFFTGLSFGLLFNVAYTLLVIQFGSAGLRNVYVLIGVFVPIFTLGFNALEEKLHLAKTTLIVLITFTILFFLSYIALRFYPVPWIIYALMIMNMMGTLYSMMLRGSHAVEIYDARTIKNRYPKITGGEILAVVLAGLLIAPLSSLFGSLESLLIVGGFSMGIALVFVWLILKRYILPVEAHHHAHAHEHHHGHSEHGVKQFVAVLKKRYTLLVFLFQMITSMISLLVQYTVYSQAQKFFPSQAEMSQFIGLAKSGTTALSFLFLTFAAGRLLVRFGMPLGIAGSPVGVAVILIAALVVGFIEGSPGQLFFIFIVISQFIDYMMYSGFAKTAVQSAFQPLPPKERDIVHTFAQGIGIPLSYGAAGLLLMGFSRMPGYTPSVAVYLTLIISVVCGVVGVFLYKAYSGALSKSLSRRSIGEIELNLKDASTMQVVDRLVDSDDPWLVKSGLDLLEQSGHPSYQERLQVLGTSNQSPSIITDVLERVEKSKFDWGKTLVSQVLNNGSPEPVQAAAVRAICALEDDPIKHVQSYLEEQSPTIRSAAVGGLFLHGGINGILQAGNVFNKMLESKNPQERIQAAGILERSGIRNFYHPLVGLIHDTDEEVVHAALRASRRIAHPNLIPEILPLIDLPSMRADVVAALGDFGEVLLQWIERSIQGDPDIPTSQAIRLIRACGRFSQKGITQVLEAGLVQTQDGELLDALYLALAQRKYRAVNSEIRTTIKTNLYSHAEKAARVLVAEHLIEALHNPQIKALESALQDLYKQEVDRIFSRCSLLYNQDDILGIQRKFAEGTGKQKALGSELLDVLLENTIKRPIIMVLEKTNKDEVEAIREEFYLPALSLSDQILEICEHSLSWPESWLVITAKHAATVLSIRDFHLEDSMLTTIERVITLKAADIFSTIPDAVLAHIASIGEDHDVAPKETFIRKGEMGDCMYIIREGKVAVHDEKTTFAELGPGRVVGEMAVLDPEPRSASVTAVEETSLLRIDKESFDSVMADHPGIARGVIHVLCNRLRKSNK